MVLRQRIPQQLIRNMRIDFRRTHAGVAEHLLHGEEVGSAFQQMGGKTMPKCVWTYGFVYAVLFRQLFHDEEDHLAREARTTAVEENDVGEFGLWRDV